MNFKTVRIICRVIGTIAALMGFFQVWWGSRFLLHYVKHPENAAFALVFSCVSFAFGAYGLLVGYAVWFRFSPVALRHICFILGIVLWAVLVGSLEKVIGQKTLAFAYIGGFILMSYLCRWLSHKVIVRIFPESLESGN